MTKENVSRIRKVYGIVLSILIVIAGICLMVQCVSIYRSGDQPFSREAVAAHFAPIAVPVWLCVAAVFGGFALDLLLPKAPEKGIRQKQYGMILENLREKKDLSLCGEALRNAIAAEQKSRALHKRICGILCAVCAVIFLCYGMNPANFHQSEINASMIRAMYVLLPCLCVSFACGIFTARHCSASIQREISLLKQAPSGGACVSDQPSASKNKTGLLRWAVALLAVALLVFGAFSGGTEDVLTKAINICTECVGLG